MRGSKRAVLRRGNERVELTITAWARDRMRVQLPDSLSAGDYLLRVYDRDERGGSNPLAVQVLLEGPSTGLDGSTAAPRRSRLLRRQERRTRRMRRRR